MRVIAARFVDRRAAVGVLESLRRSFGLGPADADVAPLAAGAYQMTVLAGRFRESKVREVLEIIRGSGGEVVADVDEGWTLARRPSLAAEAPSGGGSPQSLR